MQTGNNALKKNRGIKTAVFASVLAFCVLAFKVPAQAAELTLSLEGEQPSVSIGDSITILYQAVPDGEASAPTVTLTYDINRLAMMQADHDYTGDGGALVFTDLEGSVTFAALSGGDAVITGTAVFDAEGTSRAEASYTLSVEGEDTAAMAIAEPESTTGATIATPDGALLVSTLFPDEYLPLNFHKETVTYQGQQAESAGFDNGDITLLYTIDSSGQNGSYKRYDPASGELTDFRIINGPEGKYIMILKAPEEVTAPEGYTKATLQWNGENFEAYMKMGNSTEAVASDFFLVYATSSEGNTGWYMYDQGEGTYQRFLVDEYAGNSSSEEEGFSLAGIPLPGLIIIGVLAVLVILFLIIMIISLVKLREYESYEYIDEDEEVPEQPVTEKEAPAKKERAHTGHTGRINLAEENAKKGRTAELQITEDIDDEPDEELFDPRKAKKEAKEKQKSDKKKGLFGRKEEEAGSLDFAAMEDALKQDDARRPGKAEPAPYMRQEPETEPETEMLKETEGKPETTETVPAKAASGVTPKAPATAPQGGPEVPSEGGQLYQAVTQTGEIKNSASEPAKTKTAAPKQAAAPAREKKKAPAEAKTEMAKTQIGEDQKREELLQAAKKPELQSAKAPVQYGYEDNINGSGQQGGYYGQQGTADQSYQQQYAPQYSQNSYGNGYGNAAYGAQYGGNINGQGYTQGQNQYSYGYDPYGNTYGTQYAGNVNGQGYGQGQYYEPVPSTPQYNREQFAGAQYGGGYGNQGYDPYGQGVPGQYGVPQETVNLELDDDFEFEFLNVGDE
ncbi:MAG: hypothetical protein IJ873_02535 [Lachnospiraceae bacterium]|nr:hypothetical protein [Lachnospiraceae bacterium]